jgi:hypothetical protein
MSRHALTAIAVAVLAVVFGWILFVGLPRWSGARAPQNTDGRATTTAPAAPSTQAPGARKITATL